MKSRKDFKQIVVDDKIYQYAVSPKTQYVIIYDEKDCKTMIPFQIKGMNVTWRGKNGDGPWGEKEVAILIRDWL